MNTNRRSQYASYSHKDFLQKNRITQGMSRKRNCWDKAVAESFFHTLCPQGTLRKWNSYIKKHFEYENKIMLQNEIVA